MFHSPSDLLFASISTSEGNVIHSNDPREPLTLSQASTVRLAFGTLHFQNSFQKWVSENDFLKSTQTSDFGSL